MFVSSSWEKQIKPSVIAAKSDGGLKVSPRCNSNCDIKLSSVWMRPLLQPHPSQVHPRERGGEMNDVHIACRSHRLQFPAARTSVGFYSNQQILVALLLLEGIGSGIASLASRPFDEVVETIYDCRLCRIALLHCIGLTAESHDSHKASLVIHRSRATFEL